MATFIRVDKLGVITTIQECYGKDNPIPIEGEDLIELTDDIKQTIKDEVFSEPDKTYIFDKITRQVIKV